MEGRHNEQAAIHTVKIFPGYVTMIYIPSTESRHTPDVRVEYAAEMDGYREAVMALPSQDAALVCMQSLPVSRTAPSP